MVSVDQVDKVREKIVSGRYFQFQFSMLQVLSKSLQERGDSSKEQAVP